MYIRIGEETLPTTDTKRAFYYAESVLCDLADVCVNLMSLHPEIQSECRSLPQNRVSYIVAMYSCSCLRDFGITS